MENKIQRAMKKFEGKNVRVTITGIIESKYYINNFKYEIEGTILNMQDGDNAYLNINIDDIEGLYLESVPNGYAVLVLDVGEDIQIEMQIKDQNVIPIRNKLWKWMEENAVTEEIIGKMACGA